MNGNNSNNYNNNEKEEIRFDENDFSNPYSDISPRETGHYANQNSAGQGGNPYNNFYRENHRSEPHREYGNPYSRGGNNYNTTTLLEDEEKAKQHFSRIGKGYALFSVITLLVSTVIAVVVSFVNPDFYNTTLFLNLLTPLSLYVFALPVLLIVLSKCEAKAPEKRKMRFGEWMLFLIASFGFMYIGSFIGNAVMDYLSQVMGYDYGNSLESIVDNENILITAFFTVIVAPIGEEFVFRKLIIDRTQKYGPLLSIGLSGLMFGLMHGNFYQFFYCFALGIVLGYVYYTTGKLYLTIALHAVINLVGGVLTTLLAPISDALLTLDLEDPEAIISFASENILGVIALAVFTLFIYASIACAIIFPLAFKNKLKERLHGAQIPIQKGKVFPIAIMNGGMIAMFVIYFLEFGLNLLPI